MNKKELPFEPLPLFAHYHQQTILGAFLGFAAEPTLTETCYVKLQDGDQMAYEVTTPPSWTSQDPSVLMIHGLCGSHRSIYVVRMAKKLMKRGIRAIRINLRGCGTGKGLARKFYHGGQSNDILAVVQDVAKKTPLSPLMLMGFSLGGNLALKLAGEERREMPLSLQRVVAVSPPMDLKASVERLNQEDNHMYQRYFIRLLQEDIDERRKLFPEERYIHLHKEMTLKQFDALYIVPTFGFRTSWDYYQKASSINYIEGISVPTSIIISKDDPIISSAAIEKEIFPPNLHVFMTQKGGHMGYLGTPGKRFYWLDAILLDWVDDWKTKIAFG